jgi:SAM-dependent methyltransferase
MNEQLVPGAGEAWKAYFKGDTLSWCDPDALSADSFSRYGRSAWIQSILANIDFPLSPATPVLEAGCGTGMFALTLAQCGCPVDAFDYNFRALEFARRLEVKARQLKSDLRVRFFQGNLLAIDAPDHTYACVFNQAVFENFTDDAERIRGLQEMARVTRVGGWVVVIVQHTCHPWQRVWRALGWPGYVDQPPVIDYTPDRLHSEFETAGLTDVQVDGIEPWKALPVFWLPWYKRWHLAETAVYFGGQVLKKCVPLPRSLRTRFGVQILAAGKKK